MGGWAFSVILDIIREHMSAFWRCSLNMGLKLGSQTLPHNLRSLVRSRLG